MINYQECRLRASPFDLSLPTGLIIHGYTLIEWLITLIFSLTSRFSKLETLNFLRSFDFKLVKFFFRPTTNSFEKKKFPTERAKKFFRFSFS